IHLDRLRPAQRLVCLRQRRSERPSRAQKEPATRTAFHPTPPPPARLGVPRQPSSSRPSWRDSTRIGLCPMIFRIVARSCMVWGASEKRPPARCQLSFRPVPPTIKHSPFSSGGGAIFEKYSIAARHASQSNP